MNKRIPAWIAVATMFATVTCRWLTGAPTIVLDETAFKEGETQLREYIELDATMGELLEIGLNSDGRVEQVQYRYPITEIEADVFLEEHLTYSLGSMQGKPDPDAYYPILFLFFANTGARDKQIQFVYEIPKDFAVNVDEVEFSPIPDEIINPDIVVRYDLVLPAAPAGDTGEGMETGLWISGITTPPVINYVMAKSRLRVQAYNQMLKKCKEAPIADRNDCYLSLVTDFQDVMDTDGILNICTTEMTGLERRICMSMAKDSPAECDRASDIPDREVCKGYYVYNKCKDLDGGELQACLKNTSIASKAILGCVDIEDADVRNECHAKASGQASYCAKINNKARREDCEKTLKSSAEIADQAQPAAVDVDIERWFDDDTADDECDSFAAVFPGYTLNYTTAGMSDDVATLTCQMDANESDLDGTLYEVTVWIHAYQSSEMAQQVWETDDLDGYTLAAKRNQQAENTDPDLVFTLETERYFSVLAGTRTDMPTVYSISAGALYRNARLVFLLDSYSDSPGSWSQVEALFKQLIDSKISGR